MSEPVPPPKKPGRTPWRKRARLGGIVLLPLGLLAIGAWFGLRGPTFPETLWLRMSLHGPQVGTRTEPGSALEAASVWKSDDSKQLTLLLPATPLRSEFDQRVSGRRGVSYTARNYRLAKRTVKNEHGFWWQYELVHR